MQPFSLQNIIEGNGIIISIGGMLIVFAGLAILSLYIALLPRLLQLFRKGNGSNKGRKRKTGRKPRSAKQTTHEIDEDKDLASVIGLVLQMEQERLVQSSNQVITILRDHHNPSHWSKQRKMRIVPERRKNASL